MNIFIKILLILIALLTFSMLLLEIIPFIPIKTNYDYTFYHTSALKALIFPNLSIPTFIMYYLPYFGISISIVMFFIKWQNKKLLIWLFMFSSFTIIYPYKMYIVQAINQKYITNIAMNPSGYTPLNYALERNNTIKILKLLENKANPNEKILHQNHPLILMTEKNNFEAVKALIKYGAKVNSFNDFGTALHHAAKQNNFKIVKYLLEHGAKPNIKTIFHKGKYFADKKEKHGKTPLFIAVKNNNYDITKLLLEYGAKTDIKDLGNKTVFDFTNDSKMLLLLKR